MKKKTRTNKRPRGKDQLLGRGLTRLWGTKEMLPAYKLTQSGRAVSASRRLWLGGLKVDWIP